jgi:dihydrofolate synthase/folylpolyglutamate synthase
MTSISDFHDRLNWLYTLITDPEGKRYFIEKAPEIRLRELQEALARTDAFMDYAGRPQDAYQTAHIAGTSGKSTVTTMLSAALQALGQRVGHHVSPYLQVPNEKLIVNGKMVSLPGFIALVDEFRTLLETWTAQGQEQLRYGEAWVALTYLFMAREAVDWGVIEVGVGGRYDPTNVITPAVSVITNVDIDHVKTLGDTIELIAGHKAGVIKPNVPVITASQDPRVLAVIEAEAQQRGAPIYRLGHEFDLEIRTMNASGLRIDVQAPNNSYPDLRVPLSGRYQADNAACMISALDVIASDYNLDLNPTQVQTGLNQLHFPGRMEAIQTEPLVILDGAHNPHKVASLAKGLQDAYPGQTFTTLLGLLAIKDAAAICESLIPLTRRFVVTAPNVLGKPALPPHELAAALKRMAPDISITVHPVVADAVEYALATLPAEQALLVTGSIYMLGEARDCWIPREEILKDLQT